jgi:hypothetical protein
MTAQEFDMLHGLLNICYFNVQKLECFQKVSLKNSFLCTNGKIKG